MKLLTIAGSTLFAASLAHATSACTTAPLATYLNGGDLYQCTEASGALTVSYNHDLLPTYLGLSLLSGANNPADPAGITVNPGNPGFDFTSPNFHENAFLLSNQTELVHFLLDAGTRSITQTTFALDNLTVNGGALGTGVAIGQELLCVGGTFTSLPTGIVTSVTNGLLGTGAFGCNGAALIGTVGASSGPLNIITGLLGLPDVTGLSDSVSIQLSPVNQSEVDVIKLQSLISVLNGDVRDTGFGNTYTLSGNPASTPEPASAILIGCGLLLLSNRFLTRRIGRLFHA